MASEYNSLAETLAEFEINLPLDQIEQLDHYRTLLWEWNDKLNLTRHTTFEKFVSRDVVDSLELAKMLQPGERVLDLGTGGGVPGVILRICRPDLKVSLCDSTQKKAKAVESIVNDLQLPIQVHSKRAELVLQTKQFDTIVARAVASMSKILRWLEPCWFNFERLLLIKGQRWVEERGEARHFGLLKSLILRKEASYLTRGNDWESVILSITQDK